MPRKLTFIFLCVLILFLSPLFPVETGEKQVRVIVDKAPVRAEASASSYRIEVLKKGTVLSVYEMGSKNPEWLYVRYRSQRWRSVVTGFIQASMVEDAALPETPEKKPEEKAAPEIEKPPEKAPVKEQDAQPPIEKPEASPAAEKPEVENILVTESVGISLVLSPGSYVLPEYESPREPRVFLSVDTQASAVENVEKPDKPSADITQKTPEKLLERQPPVIETEPETEKETKKEEKTKEPEPEEEQAVPQIRRERPQAPRKAAVPGEESLLTLGAGYGPSHGSSVGGVLQLNTKTGFSVHIGAGYYPTTTFYSEYDWVKNMPLYSIGIKYYLPVKDRNIQPYMDLQYGGISVEAVRIVTGIQYYQYIYENIQRTLFGPSFLAGVELRFGTFGLNGAVGLSYNTTQWDYWDRDYFVTADVGLLVFLW